MSLSNIVFGIDVYLESKIVYMIVFGEILDKFIWLKEDEIILE